MEKRLLFLLAWCTQTGSCPWRYGTYVRARQETVPCLFSRRLLDTYVGTKVGAKVGTKVGRQSSLSRPPLHSPG